MSRPLVYWRPGLIGALVRMWYATGWTVYAPPVFLSLLFVYWGMFTPLQSLAVLGATFGIQLLIGLVVCWKAPE